MIVARQTCLIMGREVTRLPDLVNHGRVDQDRFLPMTRAK
jgi:hypothetical protein